MFHCLSSVRGRNLTRLVASLVVIIAAPLLCNNTAIADGAGGDPKHNSVPLDPTGDSTGTPGPTVFSISNIQPSGYSYYVQPVPRRSFYKPEIFWRKYLILYWIRL